MDSCSIFLFLFLEFIYLFNETYQSYFEIVAISRRVNRRVEEFYVSNSNFSLVITFEQNYSVEFMQSCYTAAERWKYLLPNTSETYVVLEGEYCGYYFLQPTLILDLQIHITIKEIDGLGQVLGYGAPCALDKHGFSRFGMVVIDAADVQNLYENNMLETLILHEMGHVFGIGSLWSVTKTYQVENGGYFYLLPFGNSQDLILGRVGGARVEDLGGAGTAKKHWKESVYDNELMTGYLQFGRQMPLSRLTAGALQDLGYIVDINRADFYIVPQTSRLRQLQHSSKKIFNNCSHPFGEPKLIREHFLKKKT